MSDLAISQSMLLDSASELIPVPEAPQTINEKRTPFLTFFFLRIFICEEPDRSVANPMAVENWIEARYVGVDEFVVMNAVQVVQLINLPHSWARTYQVCSSLWNYFIRRTMPAEFSIKACLPSSQLSYDSDIE